MIVCDDSATPDWIAMDLFAQAEHDELAQSIVITPDSRLLEAVAGSIERQLADMPRRGRAVMNSWAWAAFVAADVVRARTG